MRDWVILPKFENLFIKGKAKNHLFASKVLSFSVVALRLNFKQPRRQLFSGFCTADGGSCSELLGSELLGSCSELLGNCSELLGSLEPKEIF